MSRQLIVIRDVTSKGDARDESFFNPWELRDGKMIRAHAIFDSIEFNELWARVAPASG